MGLFSKSVPRPDVQISLDQPQGHIFGPGSPVTGFVTIQSPLERVLVYGQVCFIGRNKTHCIKETRRSDGSTSTTHYEDDVDLFRFSQTMAERRMSLDPELSLQSRFSFNFPRDTLEVLGSTPYAGLRSDQKQIYAANAHPLPPSFSLRNGRYRYALVEYVLEVHLEFEGSKELIMNEFDVNPHLSAEPASFSLEFRAPRPPVQTNLVPFNMPPQKYASSRLAGREKSLRNSFKDAFSSATPSVRLQMSCSAHAVLPTSTVFPVHVCVELDEISMPNIDVPTVVIRPVAVRLKSYDNWRALRRNHRPGSKDEREDSHKGDVLLNTIPECAVVDQQLAGDQKGKMTFPATFTARVPDVCPSFMSFNINHAYRLKVKIEIEVCGKTFKHEDGVWVQIMTMAA